MMLTVGLVAAAVGLAVSGRVAAVKRSATRDRKAAPSVDFLAKAQPITARVITEIPIVVGANGDADFGYKPESSYDVEGDGFRRNFGDSEHGSNDANHESFGSGDGADAEIADAALVQGEGGNEGMGDAGLGHAPQEAVDERMGAEEEHPVKTASAAADVTAQIAMPSGIGLVFAWIGNALATLFFRKRRAAVAAPEVPTSAPAPDDQRDLFGDDTSYETEKTTLEIPEVIGAERVEGHDDGEAVANKIDGDAMAAQEESGASGVSEYAIGFAPNGSGTGADDGEAFSWLPSDEELEADAAAATSQANRVGGVSEAKTAEASQADPASTQAGAEAITWTREWSQGDLGTDARVSLVKRIIMVDDEEYYASLVAGYREDAVVRAAVAPLIEAYAPKHAVALLRVMLEEGPMNDATLAIDELASLRLYDELAGIIRDGEPQLVKYAVFRVADEVDIDAFAAKHGIPMTVFSGLGQTA